MCIAAGTPNRLCKLADGGTLQLERLRHVVLDVQLDVKQRWGGGWRGGWVGGWVAAGARPAKEEGLGARQAGLRPTVLPASACRDILAIPETRADWWQFFGRHLAPRLAAGTLKLSLVNSDCWGS